MAYQQETTEFAAAGAPVADEFSEEAGGRCAGTACRWNDRGFGFIKPSDGGEDVFCHFSAITDGEVLTEGAEVEFDKVYDERKQKFRAEKVTGGAAAGTDDGYRGGGGRRNNNFSERRSGGGGGGGGRGVCYDWQKGACTRGSSCRFSHGDADEAGGDGGDGGYRSNNRGGGFGGSSGGRPRGVCYDWQAGNCTRGEGCRFAHGDEGGAAGGDSRPERKRGVCYDFQAGKCTRGEGCRFAHPAGGDDAGDDGAAGEY